MSSEHEGLVVDFKTLIRAPIEKVFEALTTAGGLDSWFTSEAEVDPRPGGSITFRWRDWGVDRITLESRGPVLEVAPPRRFVFQWTPLSNHPELLTTVAFAFSPDPRGTVAQVRESGFLRTPLGLRAFHGCATGWGEALTLAKFFIEHGVKY